MMPLLRGMICSHLNYVCRENLSGECEDSLKGSEYKNINKYYKHQNFKNGYE